MSSKTRPPRPDPQKAGRTPWALVLAVIALGAAVLAALGLVARDGTKADDKDMWKK